MLNIFLSRAVEPNGQVFPRERQSEIERCQSEKSRREKFSVWVLLQHAIEQTLGMRMDEIVFWRNSSGKWCCDRCEFSLAHSDGVVCVAISDKPVGVDIENVGAFRRKFCGDKLAAFYRRCASDKISVPPDPNEVLSLWARKEATFKMRGGVSVFACEPDKSAQTLFKSFFGEEWCISFCGAETSVEFFVAEL